MKEIKGTGNLKLIALRKEVEILLGKTSAQRVSSQYENDVQKLIHKLEVFQTELEKQNEEPQHAKEQAELAAQKCAELYDDAPFGYYILNSEGAILDLNLSGANLLGIERTAVINRKLGLFVSEDTRPVFNLFVENIFRNKTNQTCEVILISEKKTAVNVLLTGLRQANGEQCQITAINASSHNQTEAALRESKQQYQAIARSSSDAIISITTEGKVVEWNKSAEKIFGYTEVEMKGNDLAQIMPRRYKEQYDLSVHRFANGGDRSIMGKTMELQGLNKNGYEIPLELALSEWETASGKFYTGIFRDISERKRAENQFRLLSRAIEQSPVSVAITDKDGNIEYINPKFSEVTGYSADELEGKNPRALNSGYHSREFYEELWNTILSGKSWHGELRNKKKNGDYCWESAIISPILDATGEINSFLAIKEDISEKRRIIAELIDAKEKAEESDRLKSSFLANMSHEIRTPLNSIIGFSELLKDPYFDQEQKNKFIDTIVESGNNLLLIISDILDLSMLEARQMKIRKEQFSLHELLTGLEKEFAEKAINQGIALRLSIAGKSNDVIVENDIYRIRQIMNNLIVNALKFTSQGFIEIGYIQRTDFIEFHIKDTGIGIAPQYHQTIFERFRQTDSSTTRTYGGNGLGLAISKNLIELLGGEIWVESEEGKGSTFYFTIPYSWPA